MSRPPPAKSSATNKYARGASAKRGGQRKKPGPGGRKAKPKAIPDGARRVGEVKINGRFATTFCAAVDKRPEMTDIKDSVKKLRALADVLEDIKAVKAALENRRNWLTTSVIPTLMEDQDILTITVAGAGRINLRDDVYVRVSDADRPRMIAFFEDTEPDMVKETINAQTLAAWVRRQLSAGREIPDSIKITPYTQAVLVRGG